MELIGECTFNSSQVDPIVEYINGVDHDKGYNSNRVCSKQLPNGDAKKEPMAHSGLLPVCLRP